MGTHEGTVERVTAGRYDIGQIAREQPGAWAWIAFDMKTGAELDRGVAQTYEAAFAAIRREWVNQLRPGVPEGTPAPHWGQWTLSPTAQPTGTSTHLPTVQGGDL